MIFNREYIRYLKICKNKGIEPVSEARFNFVAYKFRKYDRWC